MFVRLHLRILVLLNLRIHVIDTLWLTTIFPSFNTPKNDNLKIWRKQILSKLLEEPNKFCQHGAPAFIIRIVLMKMKQLSFSTANTELCYGELLKRLENPKFHFRVLL